MFSSIGSQFLRLVDFTDVSERSQFRHKVDFNEVPENTVQIGSKFLRLVDFSDESECENTVQIYGIPKAVISGMDTDGSPLSSLCMVRAAELFPKPTLEKEDDVLQIPLTELAGESVKYLGRTDDGVLALSNYRIFLSKKSTNPETTVSVPLGLIESAITQNLFHLLISCKDASTVKCSFATSEQCSEWQRRITLSVGVPTSLESMFAFPFYAWASEHPPSTDNEWSGRLLRASRIDEDFRKEVKRLEFDLHGAWRISHANADFKLCPSYPRLLLVPGCISEDTLKSVASFRSSRRIPAVVWRHKASGAIIARCSQPEVGWLGWRNANDEQLLKALVEACGYDSGEPQRRINLKSSQSSDSAPSSPEGSHEEVMVDECKKILIVDARSYTSAVTNRARGGGCECAEYYPCSEIQFMSLGNIHVIRKSFHALRQLCASPPDIPNWLSLLERTMWFQHMSGLLAASMTVCHTIERQGRPVLVHCSDGWDRTPQIVATAQLCLDPHYRTVEGFRVLVEREWLSFGHKFADRCGHGPGADETNERCPVFLQWLDCVHQIHKQFPCSFEFSMGYLIKLAQHSHSCIFGTFLCNTVKERTENSIFDRTFSVWPFLSAPIYKNPLYVANRERVLWPAHNVRDLALWSEVYLGSLGTPNASDYPPSTNDVQESKSPLIKTRSYGDLMSIGGNYFGLQRRSSDPNMTAESHFKIHLPSDPSIETMSDCGIPSDQAISNYYSELNHLTQELQGSTTDLGVAVDKIGLNENAPHDSTKTYYATDEHRAEPGAFYEVSSPFYNSRMNENIDHISQYVSDVHKETVLLTHNGQQSDASADETDGDRLNGGDFSSLNMLHSVNLQNTSQSNSPTPTTVAQNLWHGSVETSTDTLVESSTLVPIEHYTLTTDNIASSASNSSVTPAATSNGHSNNHCDDIVDDVNSNLDLNNSKLHKPNSDSRNVILPEVHGVKPKSWTGSNQVSMDESILMQPEHQRMEISNNGRHDNLPSNPVPTHRRRRNSSNSRQETSPNKLVNGSISPSATTNSRSTPGARSLPLTPPGVLERPNAAISCPDGLAHALSEQNLRLQQIVYEHKVREEALQRELYATRIELLKKTQNQYNNQQQQLVDDPEDVVSDDFNFTHSDCGSSVGRCSISPQRNASFLSVTSLLDNIENSSVCSWEAVEDRNSAQSSSAGNLASSVLWVPDHCVSRCTGCQTEFWLGRRKHHCRSCGQIFCADCSEFWAALPDERLYQPVRVCGPCYHSVTTKIQLQQQNRNNNLQQQVNPILGHPSTQTQSTQNQYQPNNSTSMEPCKHAAVSSTNDRAPIKATTATN
ncbi:myotubularin-related protein 4 isoform X4 [Bradysia coprophila]|uniref:myotubularin-related protein 4 isoform X4 n=1 Tax=Bradysia coprophila TaxID=38358 RepID=UPI00187D9442|nr:myotubularin-related protein 4 isoform X4 [Bradysia coprophila]